MRPRVFVAQPIYGSVPAEAAMSFSRLLVNGTVAGHISGVGQSHFTWLSVSRNRLVKEAIDGSHTHMLFVDSDMVLPRDTIARLLSHRVPIVSGLYFQRVPPHKPVAMSFLGDKAVLIESYPPGLSLVGVIGMGCALIEIDVLKTMRDVFADDKWFAVEDNEGEDVFFARRCASLGVLIRLDAECRCGHVGETVFDESHYLSTKSKSV